MVMGVHLTVIGARMVPGVIPNGHLGVDIFIVLSGFLITSLLLQVVCLTIAGAFLGWRMVLGPKPWVAIGSTLFYFSNWVPRDLGTLALTWSLSIEEQFYLLWPPLLYLLLRRGARLPVIIAGLAVVVGIVCAARLALWHSLVGSEGVLAAFSRCYHGTDMRIDALLVGCIAALWVAWRGLPKPRLLERPRTPSRRPGLDGCS